MSKMKSRCCVVCPFQKRAITQERAKELVSEGKITSLDALEGCGVGFETPYWDPGTINRPCEGNPNCTEDDRGTIICQGCGVIDQLCYLDQYVIENLPKNDPLAGDLIVAVIWSFVLDEIPDFADKLLNREDFKFRKELVAELDYYDLIP